VEKLVQQLLLVGLELHQNSRTENSRRENFLEAVRAAVNREIFGRSEMHAEDASGWKVPMTVEGKLGEINLSNTQARDFLNNFDKLIDVCLEGHANEDLVYEWKDMMVMYVTLLDQLESKEKFSFEDVCRFQRDADDFCSVYISLTGRAGMTNYFHLLHSGHYSYFLRKYGNLYRYSQQGWENVNSVSKRTYHRNTARGGGPKGSSKLKPILYRLARGMLWRCGYLDGLFNYLGYDDTMKIEYGKKMQMPKLKQGAELNEKINQYANTILHFANQDDLDNILDSFDIDFESIDEEIEDDYI
jgi:hypothetical protein